MYYSKYFEVIFVDDASSGLAPHHGVMVVNVGLFGLHGLVTTDSLALSQLLRDTVDTYF
jgi:hypothetical protein